MSSESINTMRARDWFGVGLRIFALVPLLRSLDYFLILVDTIFGVSSGIPQSIMESNTAYSVMIAVIYFAAGIFLLFFATAITDFTYGRADAPAATRSDRARRSARRPATSRS